ncbi:SMP-30/gluconolactonase/LRE family protein [Pantoea phytobeneficialis]|uniref:SMP-30/gluconolactonase/LRE family protein n=1 Tax=Pantoea phytobeneficialis TaxID=2052056 RepID=A0AAP9HAJ2_9GAMM|nr:SMP-30/gluconolactonase/LRE family protein [Pantoea phytobeneficialis]MDO6406607.1 SMP-30/gluconolactonase/LRE family protein [Pantoea phytobeneficialis]QGR09698.1 hypothetical protein CTZ24_24875 [Pantoea phytobeneficialis]
MQLTESPQVILDCQNVLGESILWDDRTNQLWWTNIHAREVWCWAPGQQISPRIYAMQQRVGAIALCEGPGIALALEKGFGMMDTATGAVEWCADVESAVPDTRLNDGRVDPAGRFLCGGMHEGSPQLPHSALWRWEGNNQVSLCLPHVSCANSLCWSPDGKTLYFTDMPEGTINAYPYNPDTGEVGEPRLFADLAEQPGLADGSVVDEEGYLWNAQWGGARIVRYSPDGAIDRIVSLPIDNPTCLTFGGPQRDVLFITSAWWGLTEDQRQQQPFAGSVFAFRPGVRGQREHRFHR